MRFAVVFGCLFMSGCAATLQEYSLSTPYSLDEFKPFIGEGPSSLHGQAFLKTVGGDVKTCAGNDVFLMPATKYNAEIIAHAGKISKFSNRNEEALKFDKKSVCDAQGKFEFLSLPAKPWYVITTVTWGVPGEYTVSEQGGSLEQLVELKSGDTQVILTAKDRF